MRIRSIVITLLLLSSSCVTEKAGRGERAAAGATRVAFGAPLVLGGVGGLIGTGLTTAYALTAFPPESHGSVLVGAASYAGFAVIEIIVGGVLIGTGSPMLSEAIDGAGDPNEDANARIQRLRREVQDLREREPQAVPCTPGWDCPVDD